MHGEIMTPEEIRGLRLQKPQREVLRLIQRYIEDKDRRSENPKSPIDEYPLIKKEELKSTHPSIDEYPSITKSTHPSVKSRSFMDKMRDLRNKSFDGISWDNLKSSLTRSKSASASARRYRKSKPKPKKKCSRGKKKKKPSQRRKKQYM
jgi:hypothetical protein